MFIAALVTIATKKKVTAYSSSVIRRSQKAETTQVLISRWVDQQNIHPVDHHLAIKGHEVPPATTWVDLEDTVSERSHVCKTTYCLSLSTWNVQKRKIRRDKAVARAGEKREWRGSDREVQIFCLGWR